MNDCIEMNGDFFNSSEAMHIVIVDYLATKNCNFKISKQGANPSLRPRSISLIHQRISLALGHCSLSISHSKMHAPIEHSDPHAQTSAPTFLWGGGEQSKAVLSLTG